MKLSTVTIEHLYLQHMLNQRSTSPDLNHRFTKIHYVKYFFLNAFPIFVKDIRRLTYASIMKNITIFSLAILGVGVMLYMGIAGMSHNPKLGLLFIFVGCSTGVGLSLDIANHLKERVRKSNVRKLRP